MKCLILAGGRGERLWPLSRKNYPKQFIEISGNHSVFQDTVARNIPFCDEFIIVSNYEYKNIIENQMKAFHGISYRCIYENAMRGTTASVVLASMELQNSEFVFVVSSDCLIDASIEYREAIVEAKKKASEGGICVFGRKENEFNGRYGYIFDVDDDGKCERFVEKPESVDDINSVYRNLGMIIFRVGDLLNNVRTLQPSVYSACKAAYKSRGYYAGDITYSKEVLEKVDAISIERSILEKTSDLYCVKALFEWDELTSIEDLDKFSFKATGASVSSNCNNTIVINNSPDKAVVVNELDDAIVVNTDDAVYVGKRGSSYEIKQIIKQNPLLESYANTSTRYYRHWGYFIQLQDEHDYYVRHVFVLPGKTIYAHKHEGRHENWIVIRGNAMITLDNESQEYINHANLSIEPGTIHQISNTGNDVLEFIDVSYGDRLHEEDSLPRLTATNVNELDLGRQAEPLVKLRPIFKDYIWGGRKLIDEYGMKCDYDRASEAWVMSAHPDGQSIVANGRHEGMLFAKYIETVGRDILGWKCAPLKDFPILVKFIDARENLSIQVHPDDDYAMANEAQYGKNEMWYVLSSDEGAGLYVGFNRDVTAEEVKQAVEDGTITDLMNFFPTHPGDVFFISAGTVHAIGKGNLICEVQQSSNCTYRLYDYNRTDKYGNKRELHLDKALDVMNLNKYVPQSFSGEDADNGVVCRCKYFEVMGIDSPSEIKLEDSCFCAAVCIEGSGTLSICEVTQDIKAGEVVFIPAGEGSVTASGIGDGMKILICRI